MGSGPLATARLRISTHSGVLQEGPSRGRPIPHSWNTLEGTELAQWSFPPQRSERRRGMNYASCFSFLYAPMFSPVLLSMDI